MDRHHLSLLHHNLKKIKDIDRDIFLITLPYISSILNWIIKEEYQEKILAINKNPETFSKLFKTYSDLEPIIDMRFNEDTFIKWFSELKKVYLNLREYSMSLDNRRSFNKHQGEFIIFSEELIDRIMIIFTGSNVQNMGHWLTLELCHYYNDGKEKEINSKNPYFYEVEEGKKIKFKNISEIYKAISKEFNRQYKIEQVLKNIE